MLIQELTLTAPMSGPMVPLEQVPDPVFAQKMVGDGISIDPITSELIAPCAGVVLQVHRARHAVTLKTPEGVEILMHVGIDTVALKGVGFTAHVAEGDNVMPGDLLLSFDADYVATKATSLLTQILITNGELLNGLEYGKGAAVAGTTPVLTLKLKAPVNVAASDAASVVTGANVFIPNHQGLHARPSATLASKAKVFTSAITLHKGSASANVKSVVSLMGLELDRGDCVYLSAAGDDAEQAIETLTALLNSGLGEECEPISAPEASQNNAPAQKVDEVVLPDDGKLYGVCASPGLAVGQVWQLQRAEISLQEQGEGKAIEQEYFSQAQAKADADLQALTQSAASDEQREIFSAHRELLGDPELASKVLDLIAQGKSAAWAWHSAFEAQAEQLSKLKNVLLAARATDMRDVGHRLLSLLTGDAEQSGTIPDNVILIADDLTPSDTAKLDPKRVLGFCTATGGASSHVAIIARSLNIPAVAGMDKRALSLANGLPVMLRADDGMLHIEPAQAEVDRLVGEREAEDILDEAALMVATEAAKTQCGKHIEVVCNVGNVADVENASQFGAEGVGLLRSEFLFMQRTQAPTEDEQFEAYSKVAAAFDKNQNIIIRTLDVGGDKPLAYLPIAKEENPFLGMRGIRVSLANQAMFRVQLRAILRTSELANIHIMFPMVTTLDDLLQAKALLEEERVALGVKPIPIGIMVEVPSVAMLAEQFAEHVDFFSVGTNDLTQYTLAIDRGHPELAKSADPLNPAVLAMIGRAVEGAHKHNTWVGVCGGIASDPLAVPVLLGLGVDELSGSLSAVPRIKAAVRDQNIAACEALAQKILRVGSVAQVRELLIAHKQH